jgi:hypothetical protein
MLDGYCEVSCARCDELKNEDVVVAQVKKLSKTNAAREVT